MLMKKLLLSLLAVAGMSLSGAAAEVAVDFSAAEGLPSADASTEVSTTVIEGVDFSFFHCKKGTYSSQSYLQVSGKNYSGENAAYVEFKAPGKISKIVMTTGSNASTNVTVQLSAGGEAVGEAVKLDKKASDFTFSVPAESQSDICRFTTTNKYNAQMTKLVITYEAGEVTPPAVEKPVITTVEGEECFVATITCATEGADIYYTIDGTEPTAASDKYTAPVEMWGVNQIKAIAVKGDDKSAVASATVPLLLTDTSMFGDMESGTSFILKTQMTAIYQNGSYLYAKAGWSGNILIYGNVGKELSNGDTFTRLEGKYSPFNNLPEIVSPVIGEVTTGGTPVEPFEEATTDLVATYTLNYYLSFKDVKVDAWSGPNSTLTDADGNTVALYNQLKLPETELLSGDKCTVTGFVGIYKTNLQFYPIKIETASSGIEGITADENTPVEYYNLQGIRVANPAQGSVVIRRQGSHVSKVIVR